MAKVIRSTGPTPCNVLIVGERPGREEASRGSVLCGPSGKELNRLLLTECGIDRANTHCCNLVRDYREGANPEEYEVQRDWPLLVEEVQRVRPRYVMALGLWSARAFLGPDVTMEWASGLHFPLNTEYGKFTVMPVTHTAATLHQPKFAARCAADFRAFGRMVKGESLPTGHLSNNNGHHNYHQSPIPLEPIVAMDTEGSVEKPFCLSYSCRQGVASVQLYRGPKHRKWNCKTMDEALVVLHGAMHDLPVLAKMGVKPKQWTCTLLAAALLGLEPHGLKPLARRWLGLRMRDYDDVMREARRQKALEYLSQILDLAGDQCPIKTLK